MTPKERFLKAVHFQQPGDHVAAMELEFQITKEYVGRELILGETFAALSAKEKQYAHHENALTLIAVQEKAGLDALKELGGYWEEAPGKPAFMWLPSMEDRLDFVRTFKREAGETYFLCGNLGATLAIPDGNQLYSFSQRLFEEPGEIHKECEALLQKGLEDGQRLLEAGCDGIINASDIAFNTGTFFSPAMLDEFFFPYFERWVRQTKRQGALTIWHTDGNINAVLGRAVECGVEAIQCIDPLAGMDIVALKKAWYPRVALIGNIDCALLQTGTCSEIDQAVKVTVEGCRDGGGYVCGGCNAIFHGIPAEHYQWMVEARMRYGAADNA